jgi:hypothetical protein
MIDDEAERNRAAEAQGGQSGMRSGRGRLGSYGSGLWFIKSPRRSRTFPWDLSASTPAAKKLIAEQQAGKRVPTGKLLAELATAKLFHLEFYDRPDRTLIRLLDVAATLLSSKTDWQREQVLARQSESYRLRQQWQRRADQVWSKNPDLSCARVAELIAQPGEKANTIRRQIRRK